MQSTVNMHSCQAVTGIHLRIRRRYPAGMASNDVRICKCGHPERWSNDPHYPIEFDVQMNEYHLVRDGARAIMRFCFWCGGRLPESKRGTFFTTPHDVEMAEVTALLQDAKSHEDVLAVLGPPDEVLDLGGSDIEKATGAIHSRWSQHFRYTSRWKTLVLEVPVVLEGRFTYSICGRDLDGGTARPSNDR